MSQMTLMDAFETDQQRTLETQARKYFDTLVQKEQYVGEVYSISYETALVQIHDYHRKRVGGIPSLCFLIATRVDLDGEIDFAQEDSCALLLRVMDAAPLPNDAEAERIRVETAQRVSGENQHWDESGTMDPATHNLLSFAGVRCRVVGTFFLELGSDSATNLTLRFGSDLSNYYPNRGLKVYKPNRSALEAIVNYREPERSDSKSEERVTVGEIRYASTNRAYQGISDVKVSISPADLLSQKSALFGMTRTGKSNTTKIVAKSVFDLRFASSGLRVGQLIFDPDGEYANDNVQDQNKNLNPSALKNVWRSNTKGTKDDVVTYGILKHPNDPQRRLMLLNFYERDNLQIGKEIVDAALEDEDSKYIRNFCDVKFEPPDARDGSALTRYRRRVLAYQSLLNRAGLEPPTTFKADTSRLFNPKLLEAMEAGNGTNPAEYLWAAGIFRQKKPDWNSLSQAFGILRNFIEDKGSGYKEFEQKYAKDSSTGVWADDNLRKILEMFAFPNGSRLVGRVHSQHTSTTSSDYAEDIYQDLKVGKLVIVDQSSGDESINDSSARRIIGLIFRKNRAEFREGRTPPDVLVYVEEAHNLLPEGSDMNLKDVWVRTAKEGAKYGIGMVYATQEVSSIQRNILKNTSNWFIGHLNNTDETKELRKYYDFSDFESSIRRAQDRGFVRVKTLSNPFIIPVQIEKFEV